MHAQFIHKNKICMCVRSTARQISNFATKDGRREGENGFFFQLSIYLFIAENACRALCQILTAKTACGGGSPSHLPHSLQSSTASRRQVTRSSTAKQSKKDCCMCVERSLRLLHTLDTVDRRQCLRRPYSHSHPTSIYTPCAPLAQT